MPLITCKMHAYVILSGIVAQNPLYWDYYVVKEA